MILLHRPEQDSYSDKIEQELENLVVAHKIQRHEKTPGNRPLPFIEENDKIVSGKKEIDRYLQKLKAELRQQRMVTGDGCYIDPDTGEIC